MPVPDRVWDWAALGVLILGAMMRLWGLGAQSMWYDELFTVSTAMKTLPEIIQTAASDTSPPLFYLAEAPIAHWIGISEVAMRALPAIAGIATIWVIYLLGKRIFDAKTGFWAATLFAVSMQPLTYAQEARAYSFLMLLAALGILTLLNLAEKPGWLNASLFGLVLLAMVYDHPYGIFGGTALVVAMLAIPELRRRTGWWGIGAAGVAAVLFVPWGIVTIQQVKNVSGYVAAGTWHLSLSKDLLGDVWSVLDTFTPWPYPVLWTSVVFSLLLLMGFHGATVEKNSMPPQTGPAENPYVVNPAAAAWVVDPLAAPVPTPIARVPFRISHRDALWLLATAMLLPMVVGLLLSKWVLPIQEIRCFLIGLPAAYLIAAFGAMTHWKPLSFAMLALLLVSAFIGIPKFYASREKGYYREAVQYMLAHDAQSGRVIVSSTMMPLNINIYALIEGYSKQFWLGTADYNAAGKTLDDEISPQLKDQSSVWIVTAFVPIEDDQGRTPFDDTMGRQAGWKLIDTQRFNDLPKIEHWVRQP